MTTVTYHDYLIPILAAVIFIFYMIPAINALFVEWIPNYWYRIFIQALLMIAIIFLVLQFMNVAWVSNCDVCPPVNE